MLKQAAQNQNTGKTTWSKTLNSGVQHARCTFWVMRLDLFKGKKERDPMEYLSWTRPAKAAPKASTRTNSDCRLTSYPLTKLNPNTSFQRNMMRFAIHFPPRCNMTDRDPTAQHSNSPWSCPHPQPFLSLFREALAIFPPLVPVPAVVLGQRVWRNNPWT